MMSRSSNSDSSNGQGLQQDMKITVNMVVVEMTPPLAEAELRDEDEEMDDLEEEKDEATTAFANSEQGGGPRRFQLDYALDV
ncbi:hypothetical protein ABZP36_014621 [Zizania latifolia]